MKHLKLFENFESESDDLWSDEEFEHICKDNLEYGDEMPEKMYKIISNNHKKIYRNIVLDHAGGVLICDSKNSLLINDLLKYDYEETEDSILSFISICNEMGTDNFPCSKEFIKNIDIIIQGRIIQKLINTMEYSIELDKEIFDAFSPIVQNLIKKHPEIFRIIN